MSVPNSSNNTVAIPKGVWDAYMAALDGHDQKQISDAFCALADAVDGNDDIGETIRLTETSRNLDGSTTVGFWIG